MPSEPTKEPPHPSRVTPTGPGHVTGVQPKSWTQPLCARCWARDNPGREAARMLEPEPETCCKCGEQTKAGIYVRIDPTTVPYPQD